MTDKRTLKLRMGGGKKALFLFCMATVLCTLNPSCTNQGQSRVPAKGALTAWEWAGWLYEQDEPFFYPMCLDFCVHKAYIDGYTYLDGEEVPATVICDLKDNKVINSVLLINDSILYDYYDSRRGPRDHY